MSGGYSILRREPRATHRGPEGVWTDVEPHGITAASLDDAESYYLNNYAHDDRDGTEVVLSGPILNGRPGVRVLVIRRPQPPVEVERVTLR